MNKSLAQFVFLALWAVGISFLVSNWQAHRVSISTTKKTVEQHIKTWENAIQANRKGIKDIQDSLESLSVTEIKTAMEKGFVSIRREMKSLREEISE